MIFFVYKNSVECEYNLFSKTDFLLQVSLWEGDQKEEMHFPTKDEGPPQPPF